MKNQKIHFIITGGTIDSSYDPPTEKALPNKASTIPRYICDIVKPHFTATFETLFMKSSLDITEAMRRKMLRSIEKAKSKYIIVTHGTDTMAKSAELMDRYLRRRDQVVVFTGAMVPMRDIVLSDGGFNLGFAAAAALHLAPGVYIAMNGKIFKAGDAVKNRKQARFERK